MKKKFKYLVATDHDLEWGLTVSTVGYEEIEKEFDGRGYGDFKSAVGEAVAAHLAPIQEKFRGYMADKAFMEKSYRESAEKASYIAEKMLSKVKRKIGFVQK